MTPQTPRGDRQESAALRVPTVGEYGYRGSGQWGYTCSLCGKPFGPFRSERAAHELADLHTSECPDA